MTKPRSLKDLVGNKSHLYEDRDEQGREPQKMLGLFIPESLHKRLKVKAAQEGVSMTQALIALLETGMDADESN